MPVAKSVKLGVSNSNFFHSFNNPHQFCIGNGERNYYGRSLMVMDRNQKKQRVALWSVVSNSILVALKFTVGILIGSVSVISEAIHSAVDLLAAIIAYVAVKKSALPADDDHPYGHGKVENVSGTVEALLIFLAAIWIIYEAAQKLRHHEAVDAPFWGIVVMFISAIMNTVVSRWLMKVGKETESAALVADGWHLRTDVYTSIGVMAGLGVIWLGAKVMPGTNLWWIDPVAAILVALMIMKAAWDLTMEAGRDLLDAKLPEDEQTRIREIIGKFAPKATGMHKLRTRKSGHERFVDFHIEVDGQMTVKESHCLSHDLDTAIREKFPHAHVIVHIEPRRPEIKLTPPVG